MKVDSLSGLYKSVSILSATAFIGLNCAQPLLAYEHSIEQSFVSQTVGLRLTGDFRLKNFSLNSFSFTPMEGLREDISKKQDGMITAKDGGVQVDLPLLTMGEDIVSPGIFYNHNGLQFYQHVIHSMEGSEESQATVWPYVIGGTLLVGGVVALVVVASDDDDDDSSTSTSTSKNGSTTTAQSSSTQATTQATTLSEQDIQNVVDQASPILTQQGVSEAEIQAYVNEYNNLSDEQKQQYIDEYTPVVEEFIDEYGPDVSDAVQQILAEL